MIPVGYMYKKVVVRPDWLETESVTDVYSLSGCVSEDFAGYINNWTYKYWKHNGYWLFNSPQVILEFATEHGIDMSGTTLFYYESYEYEYDEDTKDWSTFSPELSFVTDVQTPIDKYLSGFDVTSFRMGSSPECSPLSCNSLATSFPVNEHCLFNTFAEAKEALEGGLFENSEHGPYRIFAVYRVDI